MAEELIRAGYADSDNDGIPDIVDRIQQDTAFGPGKANWTIRRRLTIAVIVTSYGVCGIMALVWMYKVLWGHDDIPPNLLNFGSTIFWTMNITATSLLVAYTGISLADTNSYRKSMVSIATSSAAAQQQRPRPRGGYGGGYDNGYGGGGYGGYGNNQGYDVYANPTPPEQPLPPLTPTSPATTMAPRQDIIR